MNEIVRMADIKPDTPLDIPTDEGPISMSARDVVRWLAPGAPEREAFRFLMVCQKAKVNPFLKEAHLVPFGGTWEVSISKSGWLKQAMRNPDFKGHEAGVIVRPKEGGPPACIDGACYDTATSLLIGGWARIHYRSDRIPLFISVQIGDYDSGKSSWVKMKSWMIRKVALVRALDEAFGLGGAYDSVEMQPPAVQAAHEPETVIDAEVVQAEYAKTDVPTLPPALLDRLATVAKAAFDAGVIDYDVWAEALRSRGVTTAAELSEVQAHDILRKLEEALAPNPIDLGTAPPSTPQGTLLRGESPPAAGDGKGFDRQAVIEEIWTMAGMCGLRDDEVARLLHGQGIVVHLDGGVVAAVDAMTDDQLSEFHGLLDSMERSMNKIEIPPLTRPEPEEAPKKRGRKPKAEVAAAPTA